MTKSELIEMLKDYSDDTVILVNGHSDGPDYNDCYEVESISVRAYKAHSWSGKYTSEFLFPGSLTDIAHPNASNHLHPDTINAVVIH
jgi:hypothetical protein